MGFNKKGEEMIEKIKTFKGTVYLNLLNVDYKATEEDLANLFSDVKIRKMEKTGAFYLIRALIKQMYPTIISLSINQ